MSKYAPPVIQHVHTIAQRDGGYACRYCGVETWTNSQDVEVWQTYHTRTGLTIYHWNISREDWDRAAEVDHVIPKSRGGKHDLSNLVICCWKCNRRKGKKTGDEYMAWLRLKGEVQS